IGLPKLSRSTGYIQPSLKLALCEIASNSLPALRCASIHFHKSSGCHESNMLNGDAGTLAQSRKKMLRCRLRLSNWEVYSYEQNAVNLQGWLFSSAIFTFSCQIVPATSGLIKALIGGLLVRERRYKNTFCNSAELLGSLRIRGCASGSLLIAEP